ncbi:protein XNDC1N [Podargus strigoides]
MAPVKISHVVSFSSQDPKYPVENLLREDNLHPWLGCPQDRSRQLRVELQLERASPIGYVDIGNCGCAFLQMEVGRSSWPLDRPYLTLVPSVALMTPADARRDQNRCGVRMLKEADFLAPAVGQKWDRLRVTCSQPFHKHSQFGLSFIRVRTPQDPQDLLPPPGPEDPPKDAEPTDGPWCSSPAFCRTFFPEPRSSSREEERLQSRLQQLEPSAGSPARLSRPAQMLLSVARSRALRPRAGSGAPGGDPDPGGPVVPGEAELLVVRPSVITTCLPKASRGNCPARGWGIPPCRCQGAPRAQRGPNSRVLPRGESPSLLVAEKHGGKCPTHPG